MPELGILGNLLAHSVNAHDVDEDAFGIGNQQALVADRDCTAINGKPVDGVRNARQREGGGIAACRREAMCTLVAEGPGVGVCPLAWREISSALTEVGDGLLEKRCERIGPLAGVGDPADQLPGVNKPVARRLVVDAIVGNHHDGRFSLCRQRLGLGPVTVEEDDIGINRKQLLGVAGPVGTALADDRSVSQLRVGQ